jgi:hypothetical protein
VGRAPRRTRHPRRRPSRRVLITSDGRHFKHPRMRSCRRLVWLTGPGRLRDLDWVYDIGHQPCPSRASKGTGSDGPRRFSHDIHPRRGVTSPRHGQLVVVSHASSSRNRLRGRARTVEGREHLSESADRLDACASHRASSPPVR